MRLDSKLEGWRVKLARNCTRPELISRICCETGFNCTHKSMTRKDNWKVRLRSKRIEEKIFGSSGPPEPRLDPSMELFLPQGTCHETCSSLVRAVQESFCGVCCPPFGALKLKDWVERHRLVDLVSLPTVE
ncbi:hypothetical protein MPTK1_8g06170 [Marchantia polymorpha subsp. ruderalis]|uniref:Uncharacterized protein n=1 Tax=Marchantia polymorpha TaxID=3197 RepID=A0A2R6XIN6_MARPO|nr:hypothetical protein MARPO_0013s0173 [Marchantia polymorpha]BBN18866.1 hypothetical protein Mp_8g06170 [Marchantia polymorpha subsp. ruderalis]|eukprot:PTQ45978.1 hypothetical protein MARPO_0013s0173 [Marchantia polymorpha]